MNALTPHTFGLPNNIWTRLKAFLLASGYCHSKGTLQNLFTDERLYGWKDDFGDIHVSGV